MAENNKKRGRSYGNGGDHGDKRAKAPARGPSGIDSHVADIYDLYKLRQPLPYHIHELSLRKIRVSRAEDFILSRDCAVCTLELFELDFQPLDQLPRDLIAFLEDSPTIQEVIIDWTDFTAPQWTAIARAIGQNANIRKCTITNDQAQYDALQPIFQLPRLEELVLGSFMIDQSQVQTLLSHPTLQKLELRRMKINMPLTDILTTELATRSTLVSQLLIEEPKGESTISQWTKLQSAILQRALKPSLKASCPLYVKDAALSQQILDIVGKEDEHRAPRELSVSTTESLPSGIIGCIPSSESPKYDFSASKHSIIVVSLPLLETGAPLSVYIDSVISILLNALQHLSCNGHLIITDSANISRSEVDEPFRNCLQDVWDEIVKRMNAFFNTRRVGVWRTSVSIQERIMIINHRYRVPELASQPSSTAEASISHEPKIWCWQKIGTNLSKEYGRFLLSHVLYNWWGNGLNFNERREIQAILEQWFMLRANGEDCDRYPIDELIKKRVGSERDAEKWVSFLTRRALVVPLVPFDIIPRIEDTSAKGVSRLSIGQFEETLQSSRVDALLRAAERHGSAHPTDELLSMMLRYGTVFGNFRQYSTNDTLFQELVDAGVDTEGFASPFNAQILLCHPPPLEGKKDQEREKLERWEPKFGSCYEDTDSIFGSIGSFFHLSFFDHDHVFLNPPTVEAVLSRTIHFIHDQLRTRPCRFHILIPAWDDLEAYQVGIASKYLTRNRTIDSQEFPSQNPYNGERKPSNKKFALLSFSSGPQL